MNPVGQHHDSRPAARNWVIRHRPEAGGRSVNQGQRQPKSDPSMSGMAGADQLAVVARRGSSAALGLSSATIDAGNGGIAQVDSAKSCRTGLKIGSG